MHIGIRVAIVTLSIWYQRTQNVRERDFFQSDDQF